jgi:hypothetical protein
LRPNRGAIKRINLRKVKYTTYGDIRIRKKLSPQAWKEAVSTVKTYYIPGVPKKCIHILRKEKTVLKL